jgi:preprotein translocase subunit SecF
MAPVDRIKAEIESIKERNKRVEADKAWETSFARRISIAVLTYLVMVIFFYFAGLPKPFTNSIVPAAAFFMSTLTLPLLKKIWLKRH